MLTIPVSADCPVTALRFTSTRTYWTEMFPRLDVDSVRREATRRAERMADYALAPTTPVAIRDLRLPAAVLAPEQWAVACQLDGPASARDLAMRNGAALTETVECLGSLIQVGLCVPVRVTRRKQVPSHAAGPVPPSAVPAQPDYPASQRRRGPAQSPSAEVLRQVLSGLRKLS